MTYNLAKYKFQAGDRVEIQNDNQGKAQHRVAGELVAEWDYSKGQTGTIVKVESYGKRGNTPPWLIVEPDPAFGFGEHTFNVKRVRKLPV